MGLNLSIYIIRSDVKQFALCDAEIRFDQDYDVFAQIEGYPRGDRPSTKLVRTLEVPSGSSINAPGADEPFDQFTLSDSCRITTALQLRNLQINQGAYNQAILAFIMALPHNTSILLRWH